MNGIYNHSISQIDCGVSPRSQGCMTQYWNFIRALQIFLPNTGWGEHLPGNGFQHMLPVRARLVYWIGNVLQVDSCKQVRNGCEKYGLTLKEGGCASVVIGTVFEVNTNPAAAKYRTNPLNFAPLPSYSERWGCQDVIYKTPIRQTEHIVSRIYPAPKICKPPFGHCSNSVREQPYVYCCVVWRRIDLI